MNISKSPPPTKISATRSLSVTEELRQLLLNGEFEPETRMQEAALANRMSVSRTPIRDALRVLAQDGLLTYAPNCGYVVKRFSKTDILKVFRVRATLEGLGCRIVAEEKPNAELLDTLAQTLKDGEELLKKRVTQDCTTDSFYDSWLTMNRRFHKAILNASDNELLSRIALTSLKVPIVFNGSFKWYQEEDFRRSLDQHNAIFNAIKNQQSDRADHLMQEHIYQASDIFKRFSDCP